MGDSGSSLTPEQQLLKLIESQSGKGTPSAKPDAGGKGSGSAPAPAVPVSLPQKSSTPPASISMPSAKSGATFSRGAKVSDPKKVDFQKFMSISALRGRLSYAQEQWIQFVNHKRESLRLKHVISFTHVSVFILSGFLFLGLAFDVLKLKSDYDAYSQISQQDRADLPLSKIRTFGSDFFEKAEKQNVFVPLEKRSELQNGQMASGSGASMRLVELIKDLKLTGISMNPTDPDRTYCMIEDIKKGVTNFLKIGDSISGMMVTFITSESVTLTLNGEEIQLR